MKQIQLTKGKLAIIDDADFENLSKYSWYFDGKYAARKLPNSRRKIRMHIHLMNPAAGFEVDHRNRNTLDYRRENLRMASHAENMCNTRHRVSALGVRGVQSRGNGFVSKIKVNGKQVYLGYFHTIKAASEAYQKASLQFHGEFSPFFKQGGSK